MTGIIMVLIVVGLTLGPIGHSALAHPMTPNLLVVFLWAVAWFRTREEALRLAVIGGLLVDLAGFSFAGLWTISALIIVIAIVGAKTRFLDAASATHSLLALTVVSLIPLILISIVTRSLVYQEILLAIIGNVILGVCVYYLLAMRLRLFSRWAGRRIG